MFDHILSFASEDAARKDAIVGKYSIDGQWRQDCCIPAVFAWNPADKTRQKYDAKWRVLIALPNMDQKLSEHPNCEQVRDRDTKKTAKSSQLLFEPMFAE